MTSGVPIGPVTQLTLEDRRAGGGESSKTSTDGPFKLAGGKKPEKKKRVGGNCLSTIKRKNGMFNGTGGETICKTERW